MGCGGTTPYLLRACNLEDLEDTDEAKEKFRFI